MRIFEWKGEPVENIREFCREHNFDLVKIRYKEETTTIKGQKIILWDVVEEWPAPFLDNLRLVSSGPTQTSVKELERIPVSEIVCKNSFDSKNESM